MYACESGTIVLFSVYKFCMSLWI